MFFVCLFFVIYLFLLFLSYPHNLGLFKMSIFGRKTHFYLIQHDISAVLQFFLMA